MRDLKADKEICDRATPGPWINDDTGEISYQDTIISLRQVVDYVPYSPDAEFIAAAREGWPEAIERAIKAERFIFLSGIGEQYHELNRLRENAQYCATCEFKAENHYKDTVARLTEENDLQRASIQELSRQVAELQDALKSALGGEHAHALDLVCAGNRIQELSAQVERMQGVVAAAENLAKRRLT